MVVRALGFGVGVARYKLVWVLISARADQRWNLFSRLGSNALKIIIDS